MKWIYGAVMSAANTVMYSYKINPRYIIAVDLNRHIMIVKDMDDILKYNEEDEALIMKLLRGNGDD